jgi:NTE family protein
MKPARWIALLLLIFLIAGEARAQEPVPAPRKKIGVVLSGGSARGFIHVGVLRWFEEHRIPVDYVGGTSMGALAGGLYAMGMNSKEIDEFVRGIDWERAISPEPPYNDLAFRRKEDRREFPTSFEFGLRNGLRAPSALSPGQGVELLLERVALPYGTLASFDELPTPFRCMATDLVEGKPVLLANGNLAEAMRASMSLPGIFAPVARGQQVLVDGGLLNNLPVDVVKQMGAEIIIVVTIFEPAAPDAARLSLLGVAGRSIDVMIDDNARRNLQLADLVLSPDTNGLGKSDFDRYAEFQQRGYDEAVRKARFLETLAVSEAEWKALQATRQARRRSVVLTPAFIAVEGVSPAQQRSLELGLRGLLGQPLETNRIEEALRRIAGLGRYASADYRLDQRDGREGLRVIVREKTHGPPILKAILNIDGSEIDDVRFEIAARLTFMDAGGPNSEWRNDFSLGNSNRISSEYYWRVGGSPLFLAPRGFVDYSRTNVYAGRARLATYAQNSVGAAVDAGFAFRRLGEMRVGYMLDHLDAHVATGAAGLPSVTGLFHSVRAQWAIDWRDAPIIPRRGFSWRAAGQWVMAGPLVAEPYPVLESRLLLAVPLTARAHLMASASGGTTAGKHVTLQPFTLGGPLRLSALGQDQLRGENYYSAGFFYLHSLSSRPLTLLGRTYVSAGYELGQAFNTMTVASPFHNGVIGLASETPLGGFFFGGSIGQNGERKMFFRLGRLF